MGYGCHCIFENMAWSWGGCQDSLVVALYAEFSWLSLTEDSRQVVRAHQKGRCRNILQGRQGRARVTYSPSVFGVCVCVCVLLLSGCCQSWLLLFVMTSLELLHCHSKPYFKSRRCKVQSFWCWARGSWPSFAADCCCILAAVWAAPELPWATTSGHCHCLQLEANYDRTL